MIFLALPAVVLLLSAGFIFAADKRKAGVSILWMSAFIASLLVWGWTLYLHWRPQIAFRVGLSPNTAESSFPLVFTLDQVSWPYMMAVASLLLIMMVTAPSRTNAENSPRLWAVFLIITLIAYAAAASGGIWPLIFCWMAFDIIDLICLFAINQKLEPDQTILMTAAIHLLGTLLAAVSLAVSQSEATTASIGFVSKNGSKILLVACALRLGIIPLHQPYVNMSHYQLGLGTMLSVSSTVTVLPILSRVSLEMLEPRLAVVLSVFTGIASLIGALGWILAQDSFHGSAYFLVAAAGLAFTSILRDQQQAAVLWGISLILTAVPLILFNSKNPVLKVLPVLIVLAFSGIPYSPNAEGWRGLIAPPFSAMDFLFILVMAMLSAGSLRHIFKNNEVQAGKRESGLRSGSFFGCMAGLVSGVLIRFLNWGNWGAGAYGPEAVTALMIGLVIFLILFLPQQKTSAAHPNEALLWIEAGLSRLWAIVQNVLDIRWLYQIFRKISGMLSVLAGFISGILEGQAGILWEIIFLSGLLAVVLSGGVK